MTMMAVMNAVLENFFAKTPDTEQEELTAPSTDSLTGLLTSIGFKNAASKVLARGGLIPCSYAAISVELDNLHSPDVDADNSSGSTIIKEIANRIRSSVRAEDLVGRSQNDEFIILMPDVKSEVAVLNIASRIQAAVNEPIIGENAQLNPSLTIGISMSTEDQNPMIEDVLYRSDQALQQARLVCRGAIHFFDCALRDEVTRAQEIERDLSDAVANNQLLLHYLPIYDIKNSVISHVEALVRWQHPEFGLVPPTDFISVAEANGTIESIDAWVLQQAFLDARQLDDCGLEGIGISINLSLEQLKLPSVVETMQSTSAAHPQQKGRIALEVTEDVFAAANHQMADRLCSLQNAGFKVFLGGFGADNASMAHLRDQRLDAIKINRSLIANIDQNQTDLAIVRSILRQAVSLGLDVIAEGVETGLCLKILAGENCRFAQGYYFSRPLPLAETIDVIQQRFETADLASALSVI